MRSKWLALVSVACGLLSGTALADSATKVDPSKPVILVVGDSLSAGYGIDIKQGWVALLEQRLSAQGYGYRVVNASVSGETSGGARGRLPKLLELHRPSIVVVEIGANDGLRGLPIKQTKDNLTAIATQSKAIGARVLLAGMQMPPNYGARYTEEFAEVFVAVAREQKAELIPFFLDGVALDMKLIQADGLHPTAAAQPRLLDNVWSHLRPMLKNKATATKR
jgi:acyl-CoA thioesterase-1